MSHKNCCNTSNDVRKSYFAKCMQLFMMRSEARNAHVVSDVRILKASSFAYAERRSWCAEYTFQ